ncbi:MAG: tRNA (adenosine(37)-N6)-threonylcarbamoyltransferase complex ATPase subunit type 1 TsaE [Candidatus Gottesmanbacteria bacterium]|nr:tRNA (adenosine(37)-N6)-threonylcarbamoyltransferase complex ATPase subunit type 1 TsaE [Candidatus Gottesmanbacteria bacterium]
MDFTYPFITTEPKETARIGQELGIHIVKSHLPANATHQALQAGKSKVKSEQDRGALTVCLYGELGSGKTTFVQGFGKALGITSRLLSPTFYIVRRYQLVKQSGFLYHIDLYRIGDEKELVELGIPEMLRDSDSIVLIEWADTLGGLLPKRRVDIRFEVLENDSHKISMERVI